jgi:hypothetical protein
MLKAIWTVAGTLIFAYGLLRLLRVVGSVAVGHFIGDDPPSASNDSGLK